MKRFLHLGGNIIAALAVLLSTLLAGPASASAATTSGVGGVAPTAPTSSSGLSIDPRKDATINPGQTIHDTLELGNLNSTAPLYLTLRVIDFTFTDQSGTPKLFLAQNAPQTTWSLKPYLSLPKSVTVAAGQTKTINYSISIPKYLGAGSYYSAILYESGLGDSGNVGLSASGATLVFVSVPGTVHEKLALQKFGAYDSTNNGVSGNYVSGITTHPPNMVAFAVKNEGNVVEAPAGSIVIKKWGHTYKTISSVNPNSELALIGQTRIYTPCIESQEDQLKLDHASGTASVTTCVNPHLPIGHYTMSLDIFYGQNGNPTQEITATASFWYLPWWLLIIIIIVLLVLIYFGWRLYRRIRRAVKGESQSQGLSRSYRMPSARSRSRFRRR